MKEIFISLILVSVLGCEQIIPGQVELAPIPPEPIKTAEERVEKFLLEVIETRPLGLGEPGVRYQASDRLEAAKILMRYYRSKAREARKALGEEGK